MSKMKTENDAPETLAAVLAEARCKYTASHILLLLDRIEAAAERERDEDRLLSAIAESDEAFARCARCNRPERAPGNAAARNADRFATAKEARTAFLRDARNTEGLDHLVRLTEIVGRVCDWLFAPAEGGAE